jgi:hypothetical protein
MTDIDTKRMRDLLDQRDAIDQELVALVGGQGKKQVKCSRCSQEGHTARTCPQKVVVE